MLDLEQAKEIIKHRKDLQEELKYFVPYHQKGDIDCGFKYGNFLTSENDNQIVIQWLDGARLCEHISPTLEQALVIIDKIEKGKGHITTDLCDYVSISYNKNSNLY